jgi:chemotaxis methyl-accepting protein methylase
MIINWEYLQRLGPAEEAAHWNALRDQFIRELVALNAIPERYFWSVDPGCGQDVTVIAMWMEDRPPVQTKHEMKPSTRVIG